MRYQIQIELKGKESTLEEIRRVSFGIQSITKEAPEVLLSGNWLNRQEEILFLSYGHQAEKLHGITYIIVDGIREEVFTPNDDSAHVIIRSKGGTP